MPRIHGWVLMLLASVVLSACSIPGFGGSTVDDGPPIPVSEEAAASFEQKAVAAGQEAQANGSSSITITQEEITSYIALRLENAAAEAGTSVTLPLTQPQIYFKESGELVLRGQLEFQGRSQLLRVAARPSAVDGSLQIDITEGSIGPVPVPGVILDQTEGLLADAILAGQDYAMLDEVRVEQGSLTLRGRRTQ